MGPSKAYQDTNDGIVMRGRKGYERHSMARIKAEVSPQSSLSSTESDVSPQSSLSSTESDPPSVSCVNSSENSSPESSVSSNGSSVTCGNSSKENSATSSSSANSDGTIVTCGNSSKENPASSANGDGSNVPGYLYLDPSTRNTDDDYDAIKKAVEDRKKVFSNILGYFDKMLDSPRTSGNSKTSNDSLRTSGNSKTSNSSPASSMSDDGSCVRSPASSMSDDGSFVGRYRFEQDGYRTQTVNDPDFASQHNNPPPMVPLQTSPSSSTSSDEYNNENLMDYSLKRKVQQTHQQNIRLGNYGSEQEPSRPQATNPWERNPGRLVPLFEPSDVLRPHNRSQDPMSIYSISENGYRHQLASFSDQPVLETEGKRQRSSCSCTKKRIIGVVVVALLVISSSAGVGVYFSQIAIKEVACRYLTNEVICPFDEEYNRIEIVSPHVYLEEGAGRTTYTLETDTDDEINGFYIRVKDNEISVRKQINECSEEGDYPIFFIGKNNSQSETKLPLQIKADNDIMQMEIIPFTSTSDHEKYVQVMCTGYHQCGTVVVDLELQAPDFGIYSVPMECSRTNLDGTLMDNYAYACTLNMNVKMFQRTKNLKCKPTVESLQTVRTKPVEQASVNVNETTQSLFILEKGKNETIKWNVNVKTLQEILHIQTKHNGVFRGNELDPNTRVSLSTRVKGSIATCEVMFRPITCIDAGSLTLHLLNATQHKEIQVTGTSTTEDCPSLVKVYVGEKLELKFTSCVPDKVQRYALNLYGKTNRNGAFLKDQPIKFEDQTTSFQGHLHLNELSVNMQKDQITCGDHMTAFMMSLETTEGDIVQNITSIAHARAGRHRYKTISTGGDFRENLPAVVNLRLHLGCRPQNLKIHINGTLLTSEYSLTADQSTGERLFSRNFSFPKITMQENGTAVELHGSFIDDEGSQRNLNITQRVLVIPDTFCQEKTPGCNYHHPYNNNMWVACGEGVIAKLRTCQPGLVFVETNCVGKCCLEDSPNNCG